MESDEKKIKVCNKDGSELIECTLEELVWAITKSNEDYIKKEGL